MRPEKITPQNTVVCVLGLGYVGLPLAVQFAECGFEVRGFDINEGRLIEICAGKYTAESPYVKKEIGKCLEFNKLVFGYGDSVISHSSPQKRHAYIICVPTPVTSTGLPAMECIEKAAQSVARNIQAGDLVILESSTYPTTLRDFVGPILEEVSGMVAGGSFYLASSPERIDPGNVSDLREIPKVVGGLTPSCADLAESLYACIKTKVIKVSSPEVAEACKMLENTFRLVNISLINEIAVLFELMGIDTFEVVKAASSKPFGFMPFYPGLGAGGHCIPVDPLYMAYIARKYGTHLKIVEDAAEINSVMPYHVVALVISGLNRKLQSVRKSKILVLGKSYKPDVADDRTSPGMEIYNRLLELGAEVRAVEPMQGDAIPGIDLGGYDCVVVTVRHKVFVDKKDQIARYIMPGSVVVDCVNLWPEGLPNMIYVGLGKGGKYE